MKQKVTATPAAGATIETEDLETVEQRDVVTPMGSYRGIRGCLYDGWRWGALHAREHLARLWPAAVVSGVGGALFVGLLAHVYFELWAPAQVMDAFTTPADGTTPSAPAVLFRPLIDTLLVVGALLCFVCASLGRGALWAQVVDVARGGSLRGAKWKERRKEELRLAARYGAFQVVTFLLYALPAGALAYGAVSLLPPLAYYPLVCVFLLLGILWQAMSAHGRYAYLVQQASLKAALRLMLHRGLRHGGSGFVVIVLSALPLCLFVAALLLPLTTFLLSYQADIVNGMLELPSGMTPPIVALEIGIDILAFAAYYLLSTWQTWMLVFKVTSDEANDRP